MQGLRNNDKISRRLDNKTTYVTGRKHASKTGCGHGSSHGKTRSHFSEEPGLSKAIETGPLNTKQLKLAKFAYDKDSRCQQEG